MRVRGMVGGLGICLDLMLLLKKASRQILYLTVFMAISALVSACAGPHGPSVPTEGSSYAAIGASDAVGIGASVPCGTTRSMNPACPGGTGYVPKIAALLSGGDTSVVLTDLGISSAVIGPDIKNFGNLYGSTFDDKCQARTGADIIPADFLTNEIPNLPVGVAYVTIFAGINDVIALTNALGCGAGGRTTAAQQAFIAAEANAFANDYAMVIIAVKKASPHARIVVANLPNIAGLPVGLNEPAATQRALQALSVSFDASIDGLTALNIPVVDLLCRTQTYTSANFSPDGLHLNDSGYADLAALMEPLLLSGAVTSLSTNCSQASLADAYEKPSAYMGSNLNSRYQASLLNAYEDRSGLLFETRRDCTFPTALPRITFSRHSVSNA
jgi:lysophospholipase L1-like esterase